MTSAGGMEDIERKVNLGNVAVGEGRCPYFCCELGINGNGQPWLYADMIAAFAESGADGSKVQVRTVDVTYSREYLDGPRDSPWGSTQRDQKEALELSMQDHHDLSNLAAELVQDYTASCWDARGLDDFVSAAEPNWLKIASPLITDLALLRAHRAQGLPLVMSTGMSSREEIDAAVETLGTDGLVLLVCTSAYPAKPQDVHLSRIETYRERYGVPVGLSYHGEEIAPVLGAVALGACFIEVHGTLSRDMYGSDQQCSFLPDEFQELVEGSMSVLDALGSGAIRRLECEEPARKKLRR